MNDSTPDKTRRLGRGLGALISSAPAAQPPAASEPREIVREIPIDRVEANPLQPRREFSDEELRELQESLAASGLLQPITVRQRATDGQYELIAGERRLRAAKRLGWKAIPALIRDATNEQMLSLALVENLQRADLNPVEEAEGYRQLTLEFGLAHQDVATAVGKDRSTVTNALRLLSLPDEVIHLLRQGTISTGHARALLALADEESIKTTARRVVTDKLSVRDVERIAQAARPTARKARGRSEPAPAPASSPEAARIADRLRRFLQTDVTVQADGQARGEVRIRFYSAEDLERVLDLILGSARHAD